MRIRILMLHGYVRIIIIIIIIIIIRKEFGVVRPVAALYNSIFERSSKTSSCIWSIIHRYFWYPVAVHSCYRS